MAEEERGAPSPLPAETLRRPAAPGAPEAAKAAPEAEGGAAALGQDRAVEAIALAADLEGPGWNLFVMGARPGTARRLAETLLAARAKARPRPSDWVYVNNFAEPNKPKAIALPAGRAARFRDSMAELIEDLSASLPAMFESEDFRSRREKIDDAFQGRQEEAFEALAKEAREKGAAILRTPMGFAVAPIHDGEVMGPEAFNKLPEAEREAAQTAIGEIQEKLQALMRAQPKLEKERREAVRALERETAQIAVGQSIEEMTERFADLPEVTAHLETVRETLIEHAGLFLISAEERSRGQGAAPAEDARFAAFTANPIVAQKGDEPGAPVMFEDHPTLMNLIGRVEHVAHQGALITNFTLIKPGALHRANGGFLLLDARQLLSEPFAWPALKRALRAGAIRIDSPAEYLGFAQTVSLEPDPIPLDLKVVVFGERLHYYLLLHYDPEMRELFKAVADFEDDAGRGPDSERELAGALAAMASREGLRPLSEGAAAALVEHAARLSDDAARLSLDLERLGDRLREADLAARRAGRAEIAREDVAAAVAAQRRRVGRIRERAQEMILRDLARVDTEGEAVGQVNGLSVSEIGDLRFGRPARITARARMGEGKLVDIEREVELGGPIHSKGVLILGGFLAGRYALEAPMSLAATLVFEQSYGGVEGDSASCAELFALLSALSGLALRQDVAVTGSVDQRGRTQAIGGVNEKIEGFFDMCAARGLSGRQGVLIPQDNVQHLMLREDVAEACAAGRFHVWPMREIDEGLALLTGRPAGARGADGAFPEGSVNARVEATLERFARARRDFARPAPGAGSGPT